MICVKQWVSNNIYGVIKCLKVFITIYVFSSLQRRLSKMLSWYCLSSLWSETSLLKSLRILGENQNICFSRAFRQKQLQSRINAWYFMFHEKNVESENTDLSKCGNSIYDCHVVQHLILPNVQNHLHLRDTNVIFLYREQNQKMARNICCQKDMVNPFCLIYWINLAAQHFDIAELIF